MQEQYSFSEAKKLFEQPFLDLIYQAQTMHRAHFPPNKLQISTLLGIKTGGCSEDCSYCSQSCRYKTSTKSQPLMPLEEIIAAAKQAKASGASRFCMGASGRFPLGSDLKIICNAISEVKKLGLEVCVTLGMLNENQISQLKEAGLDFYNHNIDTSPEFYSNVITTRTFEDRLNTLALVRKHGIKLCCGGILGLGETNDDRIKMLAFLSNLNPPPESVPINKLIKFAGTPLENAPEVSWVDFVKTIALARILMPKSHVRLSAGREQMSEEMQALCFIAGANSIFYGEKLLTAANKTKMQDDELFEKLGLERL